jgi:hypothetical protein
MRALQFALAAVVLIASLGICHADKYDEDPRPLKPVYDILRWPEDIATIPCTAWKKDGVGGWSITGTLNWTGGDMKVIRPSYQPHTPEGSIVENKCAAAAR